MSKCRYDLSEECNNTDCLDCVLDKIDAKINTPNRGTCDYFIVDEIEEIVHKYKTESEADKGKLSWLGKNCKDCGNEKCKKLGTLPKGHDCALWQKESEE